MKHKLQSNFHNYCSKYYNFRLQNCKDKLRMEGYQKRATHHNNMKNCIDALLND